MLTDMGERALVSTDAFEAKLVGMGEDVAFDMFVEPDAAAGLGHANRSLVLDHLWHGGAPTRRGDDGRELPFVPVCVRRQ